MNRHRSKVARDGYNFELYILKFNLQYSTGNISKFFIDFISVKNGNETCETSGQYTGFTETVFTEFQTLIYEPKISSH